LDRVILAGVDRGGGGQYGEGSEFENGEHHDCCYGFGAAACVLWCFMQRLPLLIKSGSDLGNNLILTRVSCTWAKDMGSNEH